jgi:hypothetical protein
MGFPLLQAMLLAGIIAAPLGSAALFVPARQHARGAGTWPAIRRSALAVIGTVILAAVVAGILRLIGASGHNLVAGVAGTAFASLVWMPVTRRWSARAHICWASSVFLFVVFLTYALEWTFNSNLGPVSTAGGVVLWLLEVFAAVLSCAYLWELCRALGTEHWRRRITPRTRLDAPDGEPPMVSLHVPAHNEPPDMVIDTLRSLLHLDYPRYEVILIDDNTDDEDLWRPVEAWCERHGVKFAHLENWPGYKSALQWYGDLLSLLFYIFLLAGAANLATGGGQLFRKLTLFLVSAIPVMVLLGLVRAIGRHHRVADQGHPGQRAAAGRDAAVPDARSGRGTGQQLGRAPGRAAGLAA